MPSKKQRVTRYVLTPKEANELADKLRANGGDNVSIRRIVGIITGHRIMWRVMAEIELAGFINATERGGE